MITNTPTVWLFTLAEIALGWAFAANDHGFVGGLIIGLAVGAHFSRASNAYLLKRFFSETKQRESGSRSEAR